MDAGPVNLTELEPAPRVLLTLDEATDASRCGHKDSPACVGSRRSPRS
jgi:hypothetical protein